MSIFRDRTNRRSPGEGTGKPVPSEGVGRYFSLIGLHFGKLVGLNLLFIVFSIPVVTIPAALCGVNRVCMKLIREGNVFLWEEFFSEFKFSFKKSLILGILFAFLLFVGYYLMSLGLTNAEFLFWYLAFWALGILAAAAGLCWGAYAFALTPLLELKTKNLLKDAFSLVMIQPGRALGVAGVNLAAALVAAAFYPLSLILLALCWFSLTQYTVCFLVNTVAQKYIIGPYEAAAGNRAEANDTGRISGH